VSLNKNCLLQEIIQI